MTSKSDQFKALVNEFAEKASALLFEDDRATLKARRHAKHPRQPSGASLVKVFFTGDKDGNTFAVCHPTSEYKRIKVDGYSQRQSRLIWKYTYENQTGTAQKRSWVGMLKTLDGHGRTVTRVEFYRASGMERIDLS